MPDPASRFQPEGPDGPSQVIDPAASAGPTRLAGRAAGRPGGSTKCTWARSRPRAPGRRPPRNWPSWPTWESRCWKSCRSPISPGDFGWGYDGVNLFAPTRLYGTPDDFRAFVDEAIALGIGVMLDVVYNHFGPNGNFLGDFSRDYFTDRYENEWGEAINFDGQNAGPVREFFLANAGYWIDEFHLDGSAATPRRRSSTLARRTSWPASAQRRPPRGRPRVDLARRRERAAAHAAGAAAATQGGFGLDALWNDDFHHAAMVRLTGRNEAYFTDYLGTAEEFIAAGEVGLSCIRGSATSGRKNGAARRPSTCQPATFVNFCKITTRSPTPDRAAHPPADQSGPTARHDRALAADARRRRCFSGARVRGSSAVLLFPR